MSEPVPPLVSTEWLADRGQVAAVVCDISDHHAVATSMAALLRDHGTPDVLVNNAGFAVYRAFEQSDADEIERLFEVNFAGHLLCTKAVLGEMIASRRGQIVNIASVAGLFTLTPNAVYGAAKSGIVAWSRALRVELDRYGIGVSVVCPGRVETPFFEHETFTRRKERRETRADRALVRRSWKRSSTRSGGIASSSSCRATGAGSLARSTSCRSGFAHNTRCSGDVSTTSTRDEPSAARPRPRSARSRGTPSREYARKGDAVYLRDPESGIIFLAEQPPLAGHGELRRRRVRDRRLPRLRQRARLEAGHDAAPAAADPRARARPATPRCRLGRAASSSRRRSRPVSTPRASSCRRWPSSLAQPAVRDRISAATSTRCSRRIPAVRRRHRVRHHRAHFDPVSFLDDIGRVLAPGGLLVVSTPDTGHWLRPLMRSRWPMLQPDQHTFLFSRRGDA